jgi:hypothetical protein
MSTTDQLPVCLFDFNKNFDISLSVKFKYVLLQTADGELLVRGWTQAEYHAGVVEETQLQHGNSFKFVVVGGGHGYADQAAFLRQRVFLLL